MNSIVFPQTLLCCFACTASDTFLAGPHEKNETHINWCFASHCSSIS